MAMIVVGMMVRLEAVMQTRVRIASLARSFPY